MGSPEAEWVEERSLSAKKSPFAWRLDGAGGLVIRMPSHTAVYSREALERLQAFMADGAWHPAPTAAEARPTAGSGRSIEAFGREELGWRKSRRTAICQLGTVFTQAGAWAWDGHTRALAFKQKVAGLDPLRAYYERRRAGESPPERRVQKPPPRPNEGAPFDLASTFRGLGKGLRAQLEVAEAGRHKGDKGRRREGALRDFLRAHLPPAYGVTEGEVVAAGGQASRQMDVLIYNALHAPVLLASDSATLLAAESVYAGIEVKPLLTSLGLAAAIENLASLKALPSTALVRPPSDYDPLKMPTRNPAVFGAIVAYEGESPLRLLDALCSLCKDRPPELWPEAILLLDKAVIYRQGFRPAVLGWSWQYARNRTPFLCVEAGANSLLFFYLLLLQDLNTKALLPPDLMKYALTLGLPEPTRRCP